MAKSTRFYYNTRYVLPIMIGVIVGFGLSLLCTPFLYCDSTSSFSIGLFDFDSSANLSSRQLAKIKKDQLKMFMLEQQQLQMDEFEPRINLEGKPKRPQKAVQKLVRPRYMSAELNIRNKLFIGILSTKRILSPLTSYLNQSLARSSSKVTFFVNNAEMSERLLFESTPPGVKVVNFKDDRDHLLAFHSLKYVIDNYIDSFDWFFFVTDETFIRANKLLDSVNHMSITQNLYMGKVVDPKESIYCSISSGIIFSNNLLRMLLPNMEWCIKNSYSEDLSDNIGRCVLHSSNLACANKTNGRNVNFYQDFNFNFDNAIDQLIYSPGFNESITITKVNDIETMKKLDLYFNAVEMDEINFEISKIETIIKEIVCETPDGCESLVWPLGVASPYKPTSRHEVIRWDYFNQTHIFLGNDFDSIEKLTDIDEALNHAVSHLNKKFNRNKYELRRLVNGYKQLDPTRGAAYTFDLLVFDVDFGANVHKRVDLNRAFGHVEIIPMPYVTETQLINLIVPFSIDVEPSQIGAFFSSYERLILSHREVADKVNLFVVFFNSSSSLGDVYNKQELETFWLVDEKVKTLIKRQSPMLKTSLRVAEFEVKLDNQSMYLSESYRRMATIEQITNKLGHDELVFVGSPCMEIRPEFLNRVRLNTIKAAQVFFPIPFSEYAPVIANPTTTTSQQSAEVEINKNNGYFDSLSYEFFAFYNSDFQTSRNRFVFSRLQHRENPPNLADFPRLIEYLSDMYDLFAATPSLNILRATDQALKCRWRLDQACLRRQIQATNKVTNDRCVKQLESSLGTKAQLAMHLMKNFDKLVNLYNN